jgi:hypothetical protein
VLIGESIKESDREFIAAARNALPSLLEYVELLEAVAEKADSVVKDAGRYAKDGIPASRRANELHYTVARLVEWRERHAEEKQP